ncbi:NAD-dependent protein deacetylase of SIR2 family [Candidatus Symbiothrix dinenymphae]|nr:NAD-dependent protein deacetylase of SIR2 family [Candidatus Symbiothrix dinenymphae]
MNKKHIVFLTGAGMSAESGIATFRDSGGLWEGFDPNKVASIEGWYADRAMMQDFYNARRAQLVDVEPNAGHKVIAELEADCDVTVITQNVDNLHERAGSTNVIHLHGELTKACNEAKTDVLEIGTRAILKDERAADGSFLRPFIVWFGEQVPEIARAAEIVATADTVVIVGTSMQVYPAAGLINYATRDASLFLIDPSEVAVSTRVTVIKAKASEGLKQLRDALISPPPPNSSSH